MIYRKRLLTTLLALFVLGGIARADKPARHVILLIGDGMGDQQIAAASHYAHGQAGKLYLESLPHRGRMTTESHAGQITDSAAAGTAMATGRKVRNGVLSQEIPGKGKPLPTVLEILQKRGWRTGLVTTTYVTHATPAAFASHVESRKETEKIARQMFEQIRPNVVIGGGDPNIVGQAKPEKKKSKYAPAGVPVKPAGKVLSVEIARKAGYVTLTSADELAKSKLAGKKYVTAQFGAGYMPFEYDRLQHEGKGFEDYPNLRAMTAAALKVLEGSEKGFFLMVEGGMIDQACHQHALERSVHETLEFDATVRLVMEWAKDRDDTLVIVTADHETGGLKVLGGQGKGAYPKVSWSTGGHTSAKVPVFAWGVGAERFARTLDNTDLPAWLLRATRKQEDEPDADAAAMLQALQEVPF